MLNRKAPVVIMLALFFLVVGGFGQDASAAGRMTLIPSLDLDYQHDSNYFKANNGEKSVDAFIIRPGLSVGLVTPKSSFNLSYGFDVNRYSGESGISDYDYTGHKADVTAKSQVTDRLAVSMSNAYLKTRDPASSDEFNNDVTRDKYSMNRFIPGVKYRFGEKFELGAQYTSLVTDYYEGTSEDSDEDRGTFTLFYNFNKTTALGLDYQVWTRDYDDASSDYTSNQVMVRLKKNLGDFALTAGAGYHERDFDKAGEKTLNSPAWEIGLAGTLGPKTRLMSKLSQNYNDSGSGDSYYQATKLDLSADYSLIDRLNFVLKGSYQNSDYEVGSREDDKWSLSCRANYKINDIFSMALEPGYETRDSNDDTKDYDNTYILFNVKMQYDFAGR